MPRNYKNCTIYIAAANKASEETRGLEQAIDYKFNNNLDIIKVEV